MKNDISLFSFAEQIALSSNSLYSDIRYDRVRLKEFMEVNSWFGLTPEIRDKQPYISSDETAGIRAQLELWLSAYKQPHDVKLDALLAYFKPKYPKTCKLYGEFSFANAVRDKAHTWKLLDFIFANTEKEITSYSEHEIESFIRLLDEASSLASARTFADFVKYVEMSEWDYRFGSRGKIDAENGAYPLRDFAVMAYCVFNADMWGRQGLVEKAAESQQYANLWLCTAMFFVCALRGTDLAKLPAPHLPYDSALVLRDIRNGSFSDHSSATLTDELTFRLEMKGARPSKTSAHHNVPELKLFVPESLRVPLGTIIAIAIAQNPDAKPGGQFIFPGNYSHMYKRFFGTEFVDALGTRHLSIRRCNKSYLQGIDAVASVNNEPGKPKGYILAALARSHKGGIGTLPEITEIYLKDANFTGYTPEFIIREMFERGVFSFIPNALLEIYTGESFKLLPIRSQTQLIQEVGLRPNQIENILEVAESGLRKARGTVVALINSLVMEKSNVGVVLQNIASGNAPGRISECLCLMTAAGQHCPYPCRAGCIGCGYEIYTKSAMRLLMREFGRLKLARDSAHKSEAWRYTEMLNRAVLPAITEIISCAKAHSPDEDVSLLLDVAEGGMLHDCTT